MLYVFLIGRKHEWYHWDSLEEKAHYDTFKHTENEFIWSSNKIIYLHSPQEIYSYVAYYKENYARNGFDEKYLVDYLVDYLKYLDDFEFLSRFHTLVQDMKFAEKYIAAIDTNLSLIEH